ncbi:hypothetical protein LXL04_005088 [Taraxacum kok-saghyz]
MAAKKFGIKSILGILSVVSHPSGNPASTAGNGSSRYRKGSSDLVVPVGVTPYRTALRGVVAIVTVTFGCFASSLAMSIMGIVWPGPMWGTRRKWRLLAAIVGNFEKRGNDSSLLKQKLKKCDLGETAPEIEAMSPWAHHHTPLLESNSTHSESKTLQLQGGIGSPAVAPTHESVDLSLWFSLQIPLHLSIFQSSASYDLLERPK